MRITGRNLNHIKAALSHRSAILWRSLEVEDNCTKPTAEAHLYEDVKMVRTITQQQKILTAAERDEVVSKYQTGMTMTAIADEYVVYYTTVGRLLRARGVAIRERGLQR